MSILAYNGAAIIGMAGKNCVAIASDTRLGVQQQTVACDFQKVFKMNERLFVGLAGLASDVSTLQQLLKFRLNMYKLREEREIKPETFSAMLSHMLYEKRFGPYFVEPVVVGLKVRSFRLMLWFASRRSSCATRTGDWPGATLRSLALV